MQNYKISVAKDGKKYNILFKAETEAIARKRVHDQGYSILSLKVLDEKKEIGNAFIFEGLDKNGAHSHGKIVGSDIFKAYVKLRKDLEYNVLSIFSNGDKDKSDTYKKNILRDLEQEYELYYKTAKKEKIDEIRAKLNKEKEERKKMESFHLKKRLLEVNKMVDLVLQKIENILSGKTKLDLDIEQKQKIEYIYRTIVKLKKSTNITRLKEVAEKALKKIGELELERVEEYKTENSRQLLKETNQLLKKLGSKDRFIEKDKDIKYQFNKFLENIKIMFSKKERKKRNLDTGLDKGSHSYMKTLLYLKKYKEKKKENTNYIFSNILKIVKDKELREITFLKRNVIKQNIVLLNAKLKGKVYSYTFIKKGFGKILENIRNIICNVRLYLFYVILIYTFTFIVYTNINKFLKISDYNYDGLYLFLILFILYILLYLSRKFIFIIISFVIFSFFVIFGVINF